MQKLLNMSDAVVPVTGAASGIGLAIAKCLRSIGAKPLLLDFNAQALQSAVEEVYPQESSASKHAYVLDVRDTKATDACFEQIKKDHGLITHAVANAGIVVPGGILDVTDEHWHQVMNVNLHGTLYFSRAAARQLVEGKRGAIVLMASLAGLRAKQDRIAYTSSKGAIVNMARGMAADLGPHGIRVNAVAPGFVDTPIRSGQSSANRQSNLARVPLQRFGTADEIAKATLFLLSDMASYITGETLVVDGGVVSQYA